MMNTLLYVVSQVLESKKGLNKIVQGLVMFSVLILLAALIVMFHLYNQNAPEGNPVTFVCENSKTKDTFNITTNINLTDGMNKDEATSVAAQVYAKVIVEHGRHEFRCADLDNEGLWIVQFNRWYEIPMPGCTTPEGTRLILMTYSFMIDPFNQKVEFSI